MMDRKCFCTRLKIVVTNLTNYDKLEPVFIDQIAFIPWLIIFFKKSSTQCTEISLSYDYCFKIML